MIGLTTGLLQDEELIKLFIGDSVDEPLVKAVRIVRDAATNIGKGFGYVLFSNKNAAQMALAKDSLTLRNRPLRVTRVTKAKGKTTLPKTKTYSGAVGVEGEEAVLDHQMTVGSCRFS